MKQTIVSSSTAQIASVTLFVLAMSFMSNRYIWVLYPLILIIAIKPYVFPIRQWVNNNIILLSTQLLFGCIYYAIHVNNILRIELWFDEIMTLKIAQNPFASVARQALSISAFPPLHYWELWYFSHLYTYVPAQNIEFLYRIIPMLYHITSAILFAAFIQYKLIQVKSTRTYLLIGSYIAFATYFFNPLLFPYSLEVRPYAMMAFISVLTLVVIDTGIIYTVKYIPLNILCFLVSFFYAILYIPIAVVHFFKSKKNRVPIYTLIIINVIYFFYIPFIAHPKTGDLHSINVAISSALLFIQQILFPTVIHIFIMVFITVSALKDKHMKLYVIQILSIFSVITLLALLTRYFAFTPRHYILAIPFILYILLSPIIRPSTPRAYIIIGVLFIMFTLPWISKTEFMLQKPQFYPKISVGIKQILSNAKKNNIQHILIEQDTDEKNPYYWNHSYINYVSYWYINRYGFTQPIIIPSSDICQTRTPPISSLRLVYFSTNCPQPENTATLYFHPLEK